MTGWRRFVEQLLQRLEAHISGQSADERDRFRVLQIKEKFGCFMVHLASEPILEMPTAIDYAGQKSSTTCEVCGNRARSPNADIILWHEPRLRRIGVGRQLVVEIPLGARSPAREHDLLARRAIVDP
jgi:hypothetical protein